MARPSQYNALKAVVPGERPRPPSELTTEQKKIWRDVTATKPVDWFTADSFPLLMQYCRHVSTARKLTAEIDLWSGTGADKTFGILLKARVLETGAIVSLASKMRLAQQTRYDPAVANTASKNAGGDDKPWRLTGS